MRLGDTLELPDPTSPVADTNSNKIKYRISRLEWRRHLSESEGGTYAYIYIYIHIYMYIYIYIYMYSLPAPSSKKEGDETGSSKT